MLEAFERARRIGIHLSSRFVRFLSMEENRQQSHQVLVDRSSIKFLNGAVVLNRLSRAKNRQFGFQI